jgi:acyl carrier protein
MEKNEILKQLTDLFIDVLDNKDITLTEATTANDIYEWDSLTHIQLVVAIEKHFNLRFTAAEIRNWKNVGEMCQSIENRLKNAI